MCIYAKHFKGIFPKADPRTCHIWDGELCTLWHYVTVFDYCCRVPGIRWDKVPGSIWKLYHPESLVCKNVVFISHSNYPNDKATDIVKLIISDIYHVCQICIILVRYVSCLSDMYHACHICIMFVRYVSCLPDIYHACQIYIMLIRYVSCLSDIYYTCALSKLI